MKRSAARSRSAVVTPGRILPARRAIVFTRMAPAAAIFSISAGVFLTIMTKRLQALFEAQRRQRGADVVVDLHLVARAVEAAQQAPVVVVVDQRLGLLVVGLEPLPDDLGAVVVAVPGGPGGLVGPFLVL